MIRALLAACLLLAGCGNPVTVATPAPISHPGAVNAFDSNTWDLLMSAQKSIEDAKVDTPPQFVAPLAQVRAIYNTTMHAYQVYHAAAVAGSSPDTAALQAQITQLKASLASLLAQMSGVKP